MLFYLMLEHAGTYPSNSIHPSAHLRGVGAFLITTTLDLFSISSAFKSIQKQPHHVSSGLVRQNSRKRTLTTTRLGKKRKM